MTVGGWLSIMAGAGLGGLVVADVFLTIVHPDLEGPIATRLQREVWRTARALGRRWRRRSRGLIALAGPMMAVLTFTVWIGLFILAFALLVWPFLHGYAAAPPLTDVTFVDALYYAGGTVTVLGYGDITPRAGGLRLLSVAASATGFTLFTGIVAYLIELVSGIDQRNRFALRIHDETGGGHRGADLATRSLLSEEVADLRERYDQLAALARSMQDRLHRYARASLYYRSKDPVHDPEPALALAAEAAVAGYLLAGDDRWRRLGPATEHLDLAITRVFGTLADQYLGRKVSVELEAPSPSGEDVRYVRSVAAHLRDRLGADCHLAEDDERTFTLACRCRTALAALDRLTGWSESHAPLAERLRVGADLDIPLSCESAPSVQEKPG